jgi:hypothetical protein
VRRTSGLGIMAKNGGTSYLQKTTIISKFLVIFMGAFSAFVVEIFNCPNLVTVAVRYKSQQTFSYDFACHVFTSLSP